jgi:hypothetical protein
MQRFANLADRQQGIGPGHRVLRRKLSGQDVAGLHDPAGGHHHHGLKKEARAPPTTGVQ